MKCRKCKRKVTVCKKIRLCNRCYNYQYYKVNKEKDVAKCKRYREKNREQYNQYSRNRYDKHKLRIQAIRRINSIDIGYYRSSKEVVRKQKRAYYHRNAKYYNSKKYLNMIDTGKIRNPELKTIKKHLMIVLKRNDEPELLKELRRIKLK